MEALIFKTNIRTQPDFNRVKSLFFDNPKVSECTVDLDDIDKVLRVIAEGLSVRDVERQVRLMGFYCKEMED